MTVALSSHREDGEIATFLQDKRAMPVEEHGASERQQDIDPVNDWLPFSDQDESTPSTLLVSKWKSEEPGTLSLENYITVGKLRRSNSFEWTTADTADSHSVDDPYLELRIANQRNTYSYGDFQEFDISTPPTGRAASSCPSRYYNWLADSVSQSLSKEEKPQRHKGGNSKFKKAKNYMKNMVRKPIDAAVKLTRYCKKRLK